jgi:hypothetical protein
MTRATLVTFDCFNSWTKSGSQGFHDEYVLQYPLRDESSERNHSAAGVEGLCHGRRARRRRLPQPHARSAPPLSAHIRSPQTKV